MRNPNGYGSVIKLGGKRRKAYAIRFTDVKASSQPSADGTYKQKYIYYGYYRTKREAIVILNQINHQGIDINLSNITFAQAFDCWFQRYKKNKSNSSIASMLAAYRKCIQIHDMRLTDIRLTHVQELIDNSATSKSACNNVKLICRAILNYGIENDIITKNYADFVVIPKLQQKNHIAFSRDEQALIRSKATLDVDNVYTIILCYIYLGCRPSEFSSLKLENIDIDSQTIHIIESKTKSGIRTIPIHNSILPYLKAYYENAIYNNSDCLFPMSHMSYVRKFKKLFPKHLPHDTRVTFVSNATEAELQEIVIQKIVGHSIGNVTRDIYTQLTDKYLISQVNRIP